VPGEEKRRPRIRKPFLPAVSAISPISATTPSTTPTVPASPAPTTAAASVTTAASGASAAATSAALSLRPSFVDYQVPPAEILPVQRVDGAICVFVALHFDEGKTARLSREAVSNQIDARGSNADLREPFLQLLFRRGKRKIADVELLHLPTPSARNPSKSRGAR
jgi:hypothetical protein